MQRYYELMGLGHREAGDYAFNNMAFLRSIIEKTPVKSVIDFGCSSGYSLDILNLEQKYGYDIDKEAIEIGKERGRQVTSNWDELPSVDCIILTHTIEHMKPEDFMGWISKWWEKLNRGGYLFITELNPFCIAALMQHWTDWGHYRMYDKTTLEQLLKAVAGFQFLCSGIASFDYETQTRRLMYKLLQFLRFPFFQEEYSYWILLAKGNPLGGEEVIKSIKKDEFLRNRWYYIRTYFWTPFCHPFKTWRKLRQFIKDG